MGGLEPSSLIEVYAYAPSSEKFPDLPSEFLITVKHSKLQIIHKKVVAWLSGSALVSINVVTLRGAQLVLGWVTACEQVKHLGM